MSTLTKFAAAAVSAGVVATSALMAGPAQAKKVDYAQPQVAFTGKNVQVSPDGSKAFVLGKYRCWGGSTGSHLWVSVKQGPDLDLGEHSSSSYAESWYDTNWNYSEANPAGLTADCDGHWHATRVVLKQVEGWDELTDGPALVQFCLYDSKFTGDESKSFAFDYRFSTVRVP
jgi:hypothetical protein